MWPAPARLSRPDDHLSTPSMPARQVNVFNGHVSELSSRLTETVARRPPSTSNREWFRSRPPARRCPFRGSPPDGSGTAGEMACSEGPRRPDRRDGSVALFGAMAWMPLEGPECFRLTRALTAAIRPLRGRRCLLSFGTSSRCPRRNTSSCTRWLSFPKRWGPEF